MNAIALTGGTRWPTMLSFKHGERIMGSKRALTDADRVRLMLEQAGLSQRAGAVAIGVSERSMRRYCAGWEVPKTVMLALEAVVLRARPAK